MSKFGLTISLLIVCLYSNAQNNRELYKDTCYMLVANTVSISDDGFKLDCNCPIQKFHIEFYNKLGKKVFSSDTITYSGSNKYITLWKYTDGVYKWLMRYSYVHNGQTVEKKAEGKTTFVN